MSDSFADSARVLAGLTARALGWRPGEFWQATPAELSAIFAESDARAATPLNRAELNTMLERERHG